MVFLQPESPERASVVVRGIEGGMVYGRSKREGAVVVIKQTMYSKVTKKVVACANASVVGTDSARIGLLDGDDSSDDLRQP